MTFTKQDALTFVLGLGAALLITVGEALVNAEAIRELGWSEWGTNLGIGILAATGRYLVTRIPEMLIKLGNQS